MKALKATLVQDPRAEALQALFQSLVPRPSSPEELSQSGSDFLVLLVPPNVRNAEGSTPQSPASDRPWCVRMTLC